MRVLYLGTPQFAVPAFHKLLACSHEIGAVFTQPDRPAGRGHRLQASPIKIAAAEKGIPVYQPEKIRNEENRGIFESMQPDLIVVAAYGQILPGWLLQSARLGAINIHASLLPHYRGAAPISRAILNGDSATGITTMLMAEKLDAGPILLQQEMSIPQSMTAGELTIKLADLGAELLIRTIDNLPMIVPVTQDEAKVTWAPRILKEDAQISWSKSALTIHNMIRGLHPWPIAFSLFRGQRLQILRSSLESESSESDVKAGSFVGLSSQGIRVQCGDGILELLEVQLPGKARVSGKDFALGARLSKGELLFP